MGESLGEFRHIPGDGIGLIRLQRKVVRHDQGIGEQMDTVAEFIINPRRQPRRTACPPALRSPLRSVLRSPWAAKCRGFCVLLSFDHALRLLYHAIFKMGTVLADSCTISIPLCAAEVRVRMLPGKYTFFLRFFVYIQFPTWKHPNIGRISEFFR